MKYPILICLLVGLSACGSSSADSTHAEVVAAPMSGYTCFVIKNADNQAVGGNCVKD